MTTLRSGLEAPCSNLCFPDWEQFTLLAIIWGFFAAEIEICLFYWPQDCQDDSCLWKPREDLLQDAVLSWLHLLRPSMPMHSIFSTFLYSLGTVLKSCA